MRLSNISRSRAGLFAAIAAVVLGSAGLYLRRRPTQLDKATNAYVDANACEACHGDIASSYSKTGMGQSFSRVRPEISVPEFPPRKNFYHKASDSYYTIIDHDGKPYQRRWQIGYDGQETNIDEKGMNFTIGSGKHSRAYLHLPARTPSRCCR